VALWPRASAAETAAEVEWDPAWRRFSWWNAGFTAAFGGAGATIALGVPFSEEGYRGGVLLDEPTRDVMVLPTRRQRDIAGIIGDGAFQFALVYPYVVDTVAVTWIGNGAPDVAWQMALINLQSQAFALLLGMTAAHFVGRARPSVEDCERDAGYERFCGDEDQYASFMSGHTATVATAAGLACAHNSKLPLYGDSGFGLVECIAGIVAATGTGIARIMADRHWLSDVTSGMSIGVLSGYVLPMLLHYGWSESGPPLHGLLDSRDGRLQSALVPLAGPSQLGLSWVAVY